MSYTKHCILLLLVGLNLGAIARHDALSRPFYKPVLAGQAHVWVGSLSSWAAGQLSALCRAPSIIKTYATQHPGKTLALGTTALAFGGACWWLYRQTLALNNPIGLSSDLYRLGDPTINKKDDVNKNFLIPLILANSTSVQPNSLDKINKLGSALQKTTVINTAKNKEEPKLTEENKQEVPLVKGLEEIKSLVASFLDKQISSDEFIQKGEAVVENLSEDEQKQLMETPCTPNGSTLLHFFAPYIGEEGLKKLHAEFGVDFDIKNKKGVTPLQLAKKAYQERIEHHQEEEQRKQELAKQKPLVQQIPELSKDAFEKGDEGYRGDSGGYSVPEISGEKVNLVDVPDPKKVQETLEKIFTDKKNYLSHIETLQKFIAEGANPYALDLSVVDINKKLVSETLLSRLLVPYKDKKYSVAYKKNLLNFMVYLFNNGADINGPVTMLIPFSALDYEAPLLYVLGSNSPNITFDPWNPQLISTLVKNNVNPNILNNTDKEGRGNNENILHTLRNLKLDTYQPGKYVLYDLISQLIKIGINYNQKSTDQYNRSYKRISIPSQTPPAAIERQYPNQYKILGRDIHPLTAAIFMAELKKGNELPLATHSGVIDYVLESGNIDDARLLWQHFGDEKNILLTYADENDIPDKLLKPKKDAQELKEYYARLYRQGIILKLLYALKKPIPMNVAKKFIEFSKIFDKNSELVLEYPVHDNDEEKMLWLIKAGYAIAQDFGYTKVAQFITHKLADNANAVSVD